MPWTREEAIKMSRKGASKGGLARAARLSPERRSNIAVLGAVTKWVASSEVDLMDRALVELGMLKAHARRVGDLEGYRKAIQAELPWIRAREAARRREEADEVAREERQQQNGEWRANIIAARDAEWHACLKSRGIPLDEKKS